MTARNYRDPDIEFDGTLVDGETVYSDACDCHIWLPHSALEDAHIDIHIDDSAEGPFQFGPGPVTIQGRLGSNREVTLSDVWISQGRSRSYSQRRNRRSAFGIEHVERLTDRQALNRSALGEQDDGVRTLTALLTECGYVSPPSIVQNDYKGGVSVRTVRRTSVSYPLLGNLIFDRHYSTYKRSDIHGSIRSSVLVAEIVGPPVEPTVKIEAAEGILEDICLLISLAARHRVLCIGLQYTTGAEWVRTWLSPTRRYKPEPRGAFGHGLIDIAGFEQYFAVASEKFLALADHDKMRVRSAIYVLAPAFDLGALETQMLGTFAALESLSAVGLSGPSACRETLDAQRWSHVKRQIKALISGLGPGYSMKEKDALRQKVGEVNRLSARSALESFMIRFGVESSDLWPAFGSPEAPGLAEIRNRLAHGEVFPPSVMYAMCVALSHMQLLLERCVLSVLGHPVARSRAAPAAAKRDVVTDQNEIAQMRRLLAS